jgi:UDPglucose--hexose-1-phosphate uridylyltransferase
MHELIQALLTYGKAHLQLSEEEVPFAQNQLSARLQFTLDKNLDFSNSKPHTLSSLKDLFHQSLSKVVDPQSLAFENTWIDCLSIITPASGLFQKQFWEFYQKSPFEATQWWHTLQIHNDYIKASLTQQNVTFRHAVGVHEIECTINLAKPEKRNEDIAKLVAQPKVSTYPACVICRENLGFAGSATQPSKTNMRIIDLKLAKHDWFMQYSPYAYFPFHLIAVDRIHRPMEISAYSIGRLFDFLLLFPHFFIGSNSDLPIVGGSILNHEHFQGGHYAMPLFTAPVDHSIQSPWKDVTIDRLQWFNNVIRFQSTNRIMIEQAVNHLQSFWRQYSDESVDLIAKTNAQHNTLTIITRLINKQFIAYVVLRNNRVNDAYPQGIFHAHPEYHGIKKEGIGLIESLGLMVLPARLKREFETLKEVAKTATKCPQDMMYHQPLFNLLKTTTFAQYDSVIEQYACSVSASILENTAIFKHSDQGKRAFKRFVSAWFSNN